MNRRDFAKCGLGGLLASALALVPGRAKAEAKFPRWFLPVEGTWLSGWGATALVWARGPDEIVFYNRKDMAKRLPSHRYVIAAPGSGLHRATIANCERWLTEGVMREITAAEAEALLKSKRSWTPEPWPRSGPWTWTRDYPLGTRRTAADGQPVMYLRFTTSRASDFS